MTPKEKAEELINKHRIILIQSDTDAGEEIICTTIAKQCAIIAVDLLISETFLDFTLTETKSFWQEVKTELEKL